MSFARRAVQSRRLLAAGFRKAQPSQRSWNLSTRRGYASGHGEAKASSDVPWMIGSVAVTVPVAGYLWMNGPSVEDHSEHHAGHNDDHGSRKETHDTEEEEEGTDGSEAGEANRQGEGIKEKSKKLSPDNNEGDDKKAEAKDDSEDKDDSEAKDDSKDDSKKESVESEEKDDKNSKESDDKSGSESDSDDAGKDTPETSDDEEPTEKEGSEAVGGKPYSSLQPDKINNQGAAGYKENIGQTPGEGPKAASGAIHRARNHDDKSLSKKGEGLHDTARLSEPVDPFRKQR